MTMEDLIRYYMQHYGYTRGQALQSIKFDLDRASKGTITGGKVKGGLK